MNAFDRVKAAFWRWLDRVAETMIALIARFVTKQQSFTFIQGEDGRFTPLPSDKAAKFGLRDVEIEIENGGIAGRLPQPVEAALQGARVELVLRPDRFVFKPLELPSRAAEFLEGVVRSQIDRLTPWNMEQAAFGFSAPADAGSGKIAVTVAATAKAMLLPLVNAFTAAGARSIAIYAGAPRSSPAAPPISVLEENIGRKLDVHFARKILIAGLACAFLVSAGAGIAAVIVDNGLQSRQDELAQQVAQRRAAALAALNKPGDPKTAAERALAQRKNETPSAVVALEILSQVFPDTTYVTEMQIDADKVRLTGITHDAPELIRLIEGTQHFSHAAFFAPITRSHSDLGDRFSIEARMEPSFALKP
jgi:general secretion pathway protein L